MMNKVLWVLLALLSLAHAQAEEDAPGVLEMYVEYYDAISELKPSEAIENCVRNK